MFGKNPVAKNVVAESAETGTLRVVKGSPFYTIQGEGPYMGYPAVFLRLHGCPLRCFFCDTQFSDPDDPKYNMHELVTMIEAAAGYTYGEPTHALCNLLVLTGGEPTRQDLGHVIDEMVIRRAWKVQVETAGVFWQDCLQTRDVTIVCSPKTPEIHPQILEHAAAFKYVIRAGDVSPKDGLPTASTQKEGAAAVLCRPRPGAPVYLSPMDEYEPEKNKRNTQLVGELCMRFGYRAGLQMHKYYDLP